MSETNMALIRRCDGCGAMRAYDREASLKAKRAMAMMGQTVYEVPLCELEQQIAKGEVVCTCSNGRRTDTAASILEGG